MVHSLSENVLKKGYVNNPICPCIFIKKLTIKIIIIVIYVDDLNLIGTPEELTKTINYLKMEFEIKDSKKQNIVSACGLSIVQMTF